MRRIRFHRPTAAIVAAVLCLFAPTALQAGAARRNPISKLFVTNVEGQAEIAANANVQEMKSRSVYSADGVTIETKRTTDQSSPDKGFSSMVYSNGTGVYLDPDTKMEVKKFIQEPFTPNRADMESEPSRSQTQSFLARGVVGLCNSKMAPGSSMVYATPLGEVNIRGRKVVIESNDKYTRIAMLEGESTVRPGGSGGLDLGGRTLRTGEQAFIRPAGGGLPPIIEISRIPEAEMSNLDDKVSMACIAKRTVYFEAVARSADSTEAVKEGESAAGAAEEEKGAAPGEESTGLAGFTDASGDNSGGSLISAFSEPEQELVPVLIVPVNLPVQFTVSPAKLPTN